MIWRVRFDSRTSRKPFFYCFKDKGVALRYARLVRISGVRDVRVDRVRLTTAKAEWKAATDTEAFPWPWYDEDRMPKGTVLSREKEYRRRCKILGRLRERVTLQPYERA